MKTSIFLDIFWNKYRKQTDKIESISPGKTGQEPIWVFKRKGIEVYKRLFHPGRGERITGADFALFKEVPPLKIGATAVQVKRNRRRSFFEFAKRDLKQLATFANSWGSTYYLMVDETNQPPLDCFITTHELYTLIGQINTPPPVKIPNHSVRRYCRGSNLFYDLFYRCNRGSKYIPKELSALAMSYILKTKRVVIELSTRKI